MEIKGLMEMDFRAFFLLVEIIIEIMQNPVFKKHSCKGKLIHGRENGFFSWWKPFFLSIFQRLLSVFFPSSRKIFFNKILYSGWWKRIFWLVETIFVCSEFYLQLETVTKINKSQCLKIDHVLTNKN